LKKKKLSLKLVYLNKMSNRNFRTIQTAAEVELVVKKSRFLAYAKPVSNEEQALSFIQEIRKKHVDATHNCYAYVLDELQQKASDDGEPSGTAGKPILEAIKNLTLEQTAVVVTRYFGGTMLGTGGLIRAYGEAARRVLHVAKPVEQRLHVELLIEVDYHWHGKLEHEARQRAWLIANTDFGERVTVCFLPRVEDEESMIVQLVELTQGQGIITKGMQIYRQS
jgi:uncharacterized YigZ family protein